MSSAELASQSAHSEETPRFLARFDGRWLELRHAQSPGMTPVLCLELGELDDGGTQLCGRWVHGPWDLAARSLFLLYACALVLALPALWTLPAVGAVGFLGLVAFAALSWMPARLDSDRRREAESMALWLRGLVTPYRRDLPPGAGDPFRLSPA